MNRLFRVLSIAVFCLFYWNPAAAERSADWALPVAEKGVPNLHQITANIYRCCRLRKSVEIWRQ